MRAKKSVLKLSAAAVSAERLSPWTLSLRIPCHILKLRSKPTENSHSFSMPSLSFSFLASSVRAGPLTALPSECLTWNHKYKPLSNSPNLAPFSVLRFSILPNGPSVLPTNKSNLSFCFFLGHTMLMTLPHTRPSTLNGFLLSPFS